MHLSADLRGLAGRHIDTLTCRQHTAECQRGPLETRATITRGLRSAGAELRAGANLSDYSRKHGLREKF